MRNGIKNILLVPQSKIINIGSIPIGGIHPVRIQSMTNTNTLDTSATVEQCMSLFKAGCDYVRITAQGIKEANNLAFIKKRLHEKGYFNPLIADIHFQPLAAETAARIVEKIRINPGNYTGPARISNGKLTDSEYFSQIEVMRTKVSSLISICKDYGTVIRIGVNQGSLSPRILNRYGDTPEGMVQSAIEFINVCESLDFNNIVISMKSSNVLTMVKATRLLTNRMIEAGNIYPLHLGVTEAGADEDGISKSAVGCASLLSDGIGDTLRVSLTGDPVVEVPVAQKIASFFAPLRELKPNPASKKNGEKLKVFISDTEIQRTKINLKSYTGYDFPVIINHRINSEETKDIHNLLNLCGYYFDEINNKWKKGEYSPDIINFEGEIPDVNFLNGIKYINNNIVYNENFGLMKFDGPGNSDTTSFKSNIAEIHPINIRQIYNRAYDINKDKKKTIFSLITHDYFHEDFLLYASLTLGPGLLNGDFDGICIDSDFQNNIPQVLNSCYTILQSTRKRISKTEFISCPTCGRTTFNVEVTLKRIKAKTAGLTNVKIAVMGCIVNGPGEMADADYGYVGAASGRVNIYKKGKAFLKNVPEEAAIDILLSVINDDLKQTTIDY